MINHQTKTKLISGIFTFLCLLVFIDNIHGREKNGYLDNFKNIRLNIVPVTTKWQDSILVKMYLAIPLKTLQFVKSNNEFLSGYEAQIAVMSEKGKLIHKNTWSDSIYVQSYTETVRKTEAVTLFTEKIIPVNKYVVMATVFDIESRKFHKVSQDLELETSHISYINKPVILIEKPGNWGFNPGLIPSWNYFLFSGKDSVSLFISGFSHSNNGELEWKILTKIGKEQVTGENNIPVNSKYFHHYIHLPISIFTDLSYTFTVRLKDEKKQDEKSVELVVLKPGISSLVTDIDKALDQMKYILTSEERTELKKSKKKEKEQLFKIFWDVRDPSQGTLENELMDEYYKRVAYTIIQYSGFQDGWKTDMGMIYILFGPPDEKKRFSDYSNQKAFESWYYFTVNKSFRFVDVNGFGDYQLETPHFLSIP